MASPIFRKNLYVNMIDGVPDNASPVDFFHIDLNAYPLASFVNFTEVTLNPGDCMYVPAYYYLQSETLGQGKHAETIMIAE